MPNDEIAGLARNWNGAQFFQILLARVSAGRKVIQPSLDNPVESWNATKSALIGRRIGEVQNPLDAERYGRFQTDIKVQALALKAVAGPFRRIQAALIHARP